MPGNTGLQFIVKGCEHPEGTFCVVSFTLDETLNRPFTLDISLTSSLAGILYFWRTG